MLNLADENCTPYQTGESALTDGEIGDLLLQILGWNVRNENGMQRLEKEFKFKNFAEALSFTDKIGRIADEQDHHPLIVTEWGKVTLNWWTHKVGGLHKNDFIMAAKSDRLYA